MKTCISCGELKVDPEDEARYDVLNPDFSGDPEDMKLFGPYCAECWVNTETYARGAENSPMEP